MSAKKIDAQSGNTKVRIPGLVITEKGTLIGYYEYRDSVSDWANIDIKIIRSTDKGDSWQTITLIPNDGCTLNNPVMVVQGEVIHLLYCRNYKQLFYCKSTDDGKSFSEPKEITAVFEENDVFYNVGATGPGHGIVHNGNIIIPAWFAYNKTDPKAHHPSFIRTIYSQDNGATWHLGEMIDKGLFVDPSECALAVTKENKVLISIRNANDVRRRGLAISDNGYERWENVELCDALPDPVCQGSMADQNGTVFHINCNSSTEREDLTIKISTDCFRSYESIFVDKISGYSDIAVRGDELYILYESTSTNFDTLYFKTIKYNK